MRGNTKRYNSEQIHPREDFTSGGSRGIIKSITVDDIVNAGITGENSGSIIREDLASAISETITSARREGGQFRFDAVQVVSIPRKKGEGMVVFRTNAVDRYGDPYVILELNANAVGGLTKPQVDMIFLAANNTACDCVEDAIRHEIGHAKVINGRSYANYERIAEELDGVHIEGISDEAKKDGLECIAEIEVLLARGEKVPDKALELYKIYTTGGG